jgi:hypothetical protein
MSGGGLLGTFHPICRRFRVQPGPGHRLNPQHVNQAYDNNAKTEHGNQTEGEVQPLANALVASTSLNPLIPTPTTIITTMTPVIMPCCTIKSSALLDRRPTMHEVS